MQDRLNLTKALLLSFIVILLEVVIALPFIFLLQSDKAQSQNILHTMGKLSLITYPIIVYFSISILGLFNRSIFNFTFWERLIAYLLFGGTINFIIGLLINISQTTSLGALLQMASILSGMSMIVRIISITLFEPFNLAIRRYQNKLKQLDNITQAANNQDKMNIAEKITSTAE